jgi:hypothetical protein
MSGRRRSRGGNAQDADIERPKKRASISPVPTEKLIKKQQEKQQEY